MSYHEEENNDIEIEVPMVNKFTVVLNSELRAPYADVIAPFRLVQTKYSTKGDNKETSYLDLLEELGKMGLTKNEPNKWRRQQAVTAVLGTMWDSEATISLATDDRVDRPDDKLNAYYPYNALLTRWAEGEQQSVTCQLLKDSDTVTICGKEKRHVKILKDFDRPITAVFTTNCKKFVLSNTSGICISPSDVDWEGKLKEELPKEINEELRGNVLIRFLFC
jgi:hypothetical protein